MPPLRRRRSAPTPAGVGALIDGRYELLELIGGGGMGNVYRALDRVLEREVALKALLPEIAASPDFVERFQREARVLARLEHPNIIRLHDLLRPGGGGLFLVLELVRGEPLDTVLLREPVQPWRRCAQIGVQVCDALTAAHAAGVIHRDIKPSNILIERDGTARVADFGVARLAGGASGTVVGISIGTPEYFSPEQAEGRPAGERADVYSLCVVLFEAATGRLPFHSGDGVRAISLQHINAPVPDPGDLNPTLPAAVRSLIMRGLHKDPAQRPTATALRTELEGTRDLHQEAPVTVIAPAPPAPPPPPPPHTVVDPPDTAPEVPPAAPPAPPTRAAEPEHEPAPPTRIAEPDTADAGGTTAGETRVAQADPEPAAVPESGPADPQGATATPAGRTRMRRNLTEVAPPTPAGETTLSRPSGGGAGGRVAALGAAGVLIAAGAGLTVGRAVRPTPDPVVLPPPAPLQVRAGDATTRLPGDWVTAAVSIPGLSIRDETAFTSPDGGQAVLLGTTSGVGPSLLPATFLKQLTADPGRGRPVRLGRVRAIQHSDLALRGVDGRLTVFAIPTTRGVVTLACRSRGASAGEAACRAAAAQLRLPTATVLPIDPDPAYASRLRSTLSALDRAQRKGLADLSAAGTPWGQADAAERVAAAYASAATRMAATAPGPAKRAAHASLVAALRDGQRAFTRLGAAARADGATEYRAASRAARQSDTALRAALAGLAAFGYGSR